MAEFLIKPDTKEKLTSVRNIISAPAKINYITD